MSPSYKPNWVKANQGFSVAFVLLVASFTVLIAFGKNWLTDLIFLFFSIFWILATTIIIVHLSSSVKIEGDEVTHLIFGLRNNIYSLRDLTYFEEKVGLYPGELTFKDGRKFSISGIAVGNENGLVSYLEKYCKHTKIKTYEKNL